MVGTAWWWYILIVVIVGGHGYGEVVVDDAGVAMVVSERGCMVVDIGGGQCIVIVVGDGGKVEKWEREKNWNVVITKHSNFSLSPTFYNNKTMVSTYPTTILTMTTHSTRSNNNDHSVIVNNYNTMVTTPAPAS